MGSKKVTHSLLCDASSDATRVNKTKSSQLLANLKRFAIRKDIELDYESNTIEKC